MVEKSDRWRTSSVSKALEHSNAWDSLAKIRDKEWREFKAGWDKNIEEKGLWDPIENGKYVKDEVVNRFQDYFRLETMIPGKNGYEAPKVPTDLQQATILENVPYYALRVPRGHFQVNEFLADGYLYLNVVPLTPKDYKRMKNSGIAPSGKPETIQSEDQVSFLVVCYGDGRADIYDPIKYAWTPGMSEYSVGEHIKDVYNEVSNDWDRSRKELAYLCDQGLKIRNGSRVLKRE